MTQDHLVFLPATAPGDRTYGTIPELLPEFPAATVHAVRFPDLVWYNREIRAQAVAQIRALNLPPVVLVGFSKSGLGAWNIAREHPELVGAVIIFDAPVFRDVLPPWETDAFYADDKAWREDLPLRQMAGPARLFPAGLPLILVSGATFHDEMAELSRALCRIGIEHTFHSSPNYPHHWNSGWIEAALHNYMNTTNK
jgi:pimeloyl-ACP methyl ester carboxylesterase